MLDTSSDLSEESHSIEYSCGLRELRHSAQRVPQITPIHTYFTKYNRMSNPKDEDEYILQPKLKPKSTLYANKSKNFKKTTNGKRNDSTKLVICSQVFSKVSTRKKADPVSLFLSNTLAWKRDKFLRNTGDLKEGRKLALHRRAQQMRVL